MGAVLMADMMEVRVEKLLRLRHFCLELAHVLPKGPGLVDTHVCNGDEMLNNNNTFLDI